MMRRHCHVMFGAVTLILCLLAPALLISVLLSHPFLLSPDLTRLLALRFFLFFAIASRCLCGYGVCSCFPSFFPCLSFSDSLTVCSAHCCCRFFSVVHCMVSALFCLPMSYSYSSKIHTHFHFDIHVFMPISYCYTMLCCAFVLSVYRSGECLAAAALCISLPVQCALFGSVYSQIASFNSIAIVQLSSAQLCVQSQCLAQQILFALSV